MFTIKLGLMSPWHKATSGYFERPFRTECGLVCKKIYMRSLGRTAGGMVKCPKCFPPRT